ncbi:EpsG family protein [Pseudobutyrivibrio xylanivorans]|uniref:EpsG family protein n=1 Tax=Pseudobutyrivibrio xylanivorans TaxID=185007 RepID=A0A1G5S5T2_PSEXY|nr:EpsG family protein [Pseudobutyrivibrio xylanivorans]SCZ81240.1 EpsG family protein [Pseudobutyrivibrio xylanivorans]
MHILFTIIELILLIAVLVQQVLEYKFYINARKMFCILSGLIISLFIGMRNTMVGTDMPGYIIGFKIASKTNWGEIWRTQIYNFDQGFIVFLKLLSSISSNTQMLCLGCSIISVAPVAYWIYKKSAIPYLSYVIYFGLPLFIWYYSALRQMIAIGICCMSIMAIQERRIIKFLFYVLIASLFHYTAVIFIAAYPIYWFKVSRNARRLSIMVLPLFIIFRKALFGILKHVLNKGTYDILETDSYTFFIVLCCIYILGCVMTKPMENQNGLLNLLFVACFTQAFGSVHPIASRTTYYFEIVLIILLPSLVINYRNTNTRKIIFVFTMIAFLLSAVFLTGDSGMFRGVDNYFCFEL